MYFYIIYVKYYFYIFYIIFFLYKGYKICVIYLEPLIFRRRTMSSKKERIRGVNLCIRVNKEIHEKAELACSKDNIRVNDFIRSCFIEGLDKLVKRQQIYGYRCDQAV